MLGSTVTLLERTKRQDSDFALGAERLNAGNRTLTPVLPSSTKNVVLLVQPVGVRDGEMPFTAIDSIHLLVWRRVRSGPNIQWICMGDIGRCPGWGDGATHCWPER